MKKISIKLIGIVLVFAILTSTISMAATRTELENQQKQINSDIKQKEDDLEEVKEEKNETMSEVRDLMEKISNYENEIAQLDTQVKTLNNSISETKEKLEKAEKNYSKQQELLNERLVALFEAGDTSYLDVLLTSEDFTDLISNWYLVSELATYDKDMLEKIEKQKNEIDQAKTELENNRKQLETAKSSKEAKSTELKEVKSQKDKKVTELSGEEKDLQKEIEELQKEDKEIASKIKKYKQSYQPSSGGSPSSSAPMGNESSYGFIRPVSGGYIGTGYGVTGKYWSLGYHTGIDFNGVSGNPIYSIGDGIVVQASTTGSYGNHILIYHGNGIYSHYAHGVSGSIRVSEGQNVSKGQHIMNVGATGNVTGSHLHFEIRTGNGGFRDCVNPLPYLP